MPPELTPGASYLISPRTWFLLLPPREETKHGWLIKARSEWCPPLYQPSAFGHPNHSSKYLCRGHPASAGLHARGEPANLSGALCAVLLRCPAHRYVRSAPIPPNNSNTSDCSSFLHDKSRSRTIHILSQVVWKPRRAVLPGVLELQPSGPVHLLRRGGADEVNAQHGDLSDPDEPRQSDQRLQLLPRDL